MPSCVVKSCKNYMGKLKKTQGITYHAFPRNITRKDKWIQIIRNCREDNNWNPSTASTVCSAHFDDGDFKTTTKGLRCLVPYAIPKKLLSNLEEIKTEKVSSSPMILQASLNFGGVANDQQPSSSRTTMSSLLQVPAHAENALTKYCRLCAASDCSSKILNIQSDDVMKRLVVNMLKRLNTNIDFNQEHLPTTICSACVKALYTAYDFVVGIDMAQMTINNISMQNYFDQMPENSNLACNLDVSCSSLQPTSIIKEEVANDFEEPTLDLPSNTFLLPKESRVSSNIEVADSNFEQPLLPLSSTTVSLLQISPNIGPATSKFEQPLLLASSSNIPFLLDSPRKRRLKEDIKMKRQIIEGQKKKLKRLNQKVRRLQNRNESLKNILKNLKERNYTDADLFDRLH